MRREKVVLALAVVAGCATGRTPAALVPTEPAATEAALAAAERFYLAETPEALRAAAVEVRGLAPDSAVRHDLDRVLAVMDGLDRAAVFEHALAAALDPAAALPVRRMRALSAAVETPEERRRARAALEQLGAQHPDPAARAAAGREAAEIAWLEGDWVDSRALEDQVRNRFDWRIIGTWDNDQGKAFDEAFPPERSIDLSARYEGMVGEMGWRAPALSPFGPELDLGAALSPTQWAVAYATTAFEAAEEGAYELRVTTTAAVQVWIDGQLAFAERAVTGASFDQFVVPLALAAGRHRLLVKSAQTTGAWRLGVRVTGPGGAHSPSIRPLPPGAAPTGGAEVAPLDGASAFAARAAALRGEGDMRTLALILEEASAMGLRRVVLAVSDQLLQRAPSSLYARYHRVSATWDHGERGKASDLLEALAAEHGDEMPFFLLQKARFAQQDGMLEKARAALGRAEERVSTSGAATLAQRWAEQFEAEGWTEDRCDAWARAVDLRPGWLYARLERARCLSDLRFHADARAIHEALFAEVPGHITAAQRLMAHAQDAERLEDALSYAQMLRRARPHEAWPRLQAAEILRRQRRFEEAAAEIEAARAHDPDDSAPWASLAPIRYQAGDRAAAIAAWRERLARDPTDERTANRLAWLSPSEEGRWAEDIPGEAEIAAAVAEGSNLQVAPGAHLAQLLDHEVTVLEADGSTTNVVTQVLRVLDETGRDQVTKMRLRPGGRLRVRHAYVVGPDGRRTQVSSVRSRTARFRNLSVGSTVVLQFRHDDKPVGYLSRHMARGWWFQAPATHVKRSEWVLWRPAGGGLHEWKQDPLDRVRRSEREVGGMARVAWVAEDIEPLIAEPGMPTAQEVAVNMLVSTVPDWETFLAWEKALLTDAFRDDASIGALAARIVGDAKTQRDKALRIHRWLMEEIRYQQDYEDHIAGVRPHAAPVVVERSYGDCKDKSVLFITLARQVGLAAHFALLRTRPRGPLLRSIPMQQFDHAIVYVPAQPGLEQGFFVDSTADGLDLAALREDSTGVPALVFDPESNAHEWRPIPLRPPAENGQSMATRLSVGADGAAHGVLDLRGRGQEGSGLRRLARNPRALEQAMQGLASQIYGGALSRAVVAEEVKDLEVPAHLRVELEVPSFARREGQELRARLPAVFSPRQQFSLERRQHPLVLGVPKEHEWSTEIELGPGLENRRLPSDRRIEAPCFTFERSSRKEGRRLVIEQRYVTHCERISVAAYAGHREKAQAILQALDEELVLVRR